MAYTFQTLQDDVFARGYQPLNDAGTGLAMVKRMINDSMHRIDSRYPWLYRNTTTTGVAPLAITDLGQVESVTDVLNKRTIDPADRRDLRRWFGDLTTVGTAQYYYITLGTTINLYPVQSALTLTVDYWKVAADLSAGADVPLMPDRYRPVIIEDAVYKLARLRRDPETAKIAQQARDEILGEMMRELLMPQLQATQDFVGMVGEDC